MRKVVTSTDTVNECDCCGKTGLKQTFLVTDENGGEWYYGSTCVGRNLGIDKKEVTKQINESKKQREVEARNEYRNSAEYLHDVEVMKVEYEFPSDYYTNMVCPSSDACDKLKEQIKAKYKLKYVNW